MWSWVSVQQHTQLGNFYHMTVAVEMDKKNQN